MSGLARFVVEQARFTWLLLAAMVVAGVGVYLTNPRQEDPDVTLRSAQVVTRLPGLSPERIEQLVTRPVEEQLKTIAEIETIRSVSTTGLSIVSPEIADRYSDVDPVWADLRNKMDDLAARLPEGAAVQVNDDYGRVAVITLALTGPEFTLAELDSVARDVRDRIVTLPLVARVELHGVQPERVWIEFDAAFMARFDLTLGRVVESLRAQNVVLPGGTVDAGGQSIVIEPSGDFRSVDDIRDVAIETSGGDVVYLRDLARVRRGYAEPPTAPAFFDGEPAIVLGVSMVQGANVVELGDQVTAMLGDLRRELPLGMRLDAVIFQPDLVQASVRDATVNLAQTVVVVLAVVMLALGLRTGLIVGAMVPLTMMATLVAMAVGGIELHRVSIAAIIVALGLLVDNGVVIAEDIQSRLDRGADRLEAALATPRTLAVPLLTSSLTTVAAFMPLVLVSGGSGEFLRSLGQVLAVALLSSWLLAISVIPAFCYWFLRDPTAKKGAAAEPGRPFDTPAYRLYRRLLELVLRQRLLVVAAVVFLVVSSTAALGHVKKRSLGPSERNQFTVYLDLPAEAAIGQTIAAARRVSGHLRDERQNPEVTGVLAYVGSGGPRFFLALDPNDAQPNKAFLVVNTERADQIHAVMERTERFLAEEVPEATGRAEILFLGSAPLGTVEILVRGPDIAVLRDLGHRVADAFRAVEGTRYVRNDWENPILKLRVDVDQERARRAGVTSAEIAQALASHFDGATVTTLREGELQVPVAIRARPEDRATLDSVRSVEVLSASRGVAVPLLQVADFAGVVEPSRIRRLDQERALTVSGRHPALTSAELHAAMRPRLDAIDVPDGYTLTVEGEIKESAESNRNLFRYAPHAMFAVLLLLVLQFNSFRRPAIVLLTIPLVLVGANWGLLAFGAYFDFTAMLGIFSLAGIIINNGIVLIDRIDESRREGLGVDAAVIQAAIERARPIVMTTVTTVVGLVPLALSGGEFWYGMAIVIMCGLGVGSLLTLAFVPVTYSLFFAPRGGGGPAPSAPRGAGEGSGS